ncbi:MAG: hypothetical protein ACYDA4_11785 [Ignavibacteriaceae bacterium]
MCGVALSTATHPVYEMAQGYDTPHSARWHGSIHRDGLPMSGHGRLFFPFYRLPLTEH